jgi:plasmid stability protein
MGELTIKVEDAELVEALTEMARRRQHSVGDEVTDALRRAVVEYERRMELVRRADEIAAMTPKGVKQTDSVEIIRQMREERSRDLGG